MLISIKFSNFRSYYNEQEFSMLATPQEKENYVKNSFEVNPALYKGRLLKSSMILGTNGSGKSNLLSVCKYLRYLVLFSSEASRDKSNIFKDANEQFAFFESAVDTPTFFEVEFIANNAYYIYTIKIKDCSVEYECLRQRVETTGKKLAKIKCLFERIGNQFVVVSDEFQRLADLFEIKPNVLVLSNCNSDIKDDVCPSGKTVINWFKQLNYWNSRTSSIEIYDNNVDILEKATKILQYSDKSIKSLQLKKTKLEIPVESQKDPESIFKALQKTNLDIGSGVLALLDDGLYKMDVVIEYNVYDDPLKTNITDTVAFSVFDSTSKISTGQAKLVKYLAYIIDVIQNGGILFLDELDSNLHHQFPKLITDAFNDETLNSKNAQLIFTTHSVNLLDNNFRRDQINIITKDRYGISSIAHPTRAKGRVKNTNSLSKLWYEGELNNSNIITVEDLKIIMKG